GGVFGRVRGGGVGGEKAGRASDHAGGMCDVPAGVFRVVAGAGGRGGYGRGGGLWREDPALGASRAGCDVCEEWGRGDAGDASGIPVPLFNLVYHDSSLLPWEMGEDGGWGIPKGDAGWLHCFLNAGLPYVYPGASGEVLARVKEAAALAARCAHEEMVNHEILDAGFRKQRATYAAGTVVTVEFEGKTMEVSGEP